MRHITIVGNLCADPKISFTPTGTKLAKLRIAANEMERNPVTGEYERRAEFFEVTIWRGVDTVAMHFHKGSGIAVAGDFFTSRWVDKVGDEQTTLCVGNASWWFLPRGGTPMDQAVEPISGTTKPGEGGHSDFQF